MSKTDPLTDGTARLSLPFLPTLVTALVLGAASLLCREPAAEPPAAPAALVAPPDVYAALPVEAVPPRVPAAIAFAEQYPLSPARPEPRGPALRPPARIAAARRPCAGPHCTDAARRPEPFAALARPEPVPATAEARNAAKPAAWPATLPAAQVETAGALLPDIALPDIALPFAPVTRAVGEAAALVRRGAASVGGSVSVVIDGLR